MKAQLPLVVSLTAGVLAAALWATPASADWIAEYNTDGALVNPLLFSVAGSGGEDMFPPDSNELAVSGNCLFVSNRFTDSIGQYTTSGAVVNAALVSYTDGLSAPNAIAASGGELYNLSQSSPTIGWYDGPDMFYLPGFAGAPPGYAISNSIAVSGGDIFASFEGFTYPFQSTVAEYDSNGNPINSSLISGTGPLELSISGSDLFVLNGTTISEYTTSGSLVNASVISNIEDPWGFTVSGGNIFIIYDQGAKVGEWTTSGALVDPTIYNAGPVPVWADGVAVSGDNVFISLSVLPEPSSFALLAMGAAPMLAWRLRKRLVLCQSQEFGCHWLCQCRELR